MILEITVEEYLKLQMEIIKLERPDGFVSENVIERAKLSVDEMLKTNKVNVVNLKPKLNVAGNRYR